MTKFYAAMEDGSVPPLMALDIEWCAPWFEGSYPGIHRDKVAVLQLASFGAGALVFQVHRLAELPPTMIRLLGDPGVALLGVNITGDAVRLMQSFAVSGPAVKSSNSRPSPCAPGAAAYRKRCIPFPPPRPTPCCAQTGERSVSLQR